MTMRMKSLGVRAALMVALAFSTTGCLAAAAAAGAGAAIGYSERGAKSDVGAPVATVVANSRAVLREMGFTLGSGSEGNNTTVVGTKGDMRVTVDIESEDNGASSEVYVFAREGNLDWDRDLSRDILSRIMARR
jgi:hypothetical protein